MRDFAAGAPLPPADDAVVIVGAGAAGLSLACTLGERGVAVVLLESGADATGDPAGSDDLNHGESIGFPLRPVAGRTRALGGTTRLWHGQCMRLHPIDLQPRPWLGTEGWPLGSAELAPWYDAAERWFDLSGRGYDERRWAEHPRLPPPAWDPGLLLHDFTEYAPEPDLAKRLRRKLRGHPHVSTVLRATVSRVLLDADGVCGLEIVAPGRSEVLVARRVVLSAGALENARILQLSDPGQVGLGSGRWHTGRWLQDHPVIGTAEVLSVDRRPLQDRYTAVYSGGRKLFPKIRLAPAPQERDGLLDAMAVLVHDVDESGFDAARRIGQAVRDRSTSGLEAGDTRAAARASGAAARALLRRRRGLSAGLPASRVWLQVWLEQRPDPESRLVLDTTRDAFGLPRPRIDWRMGEQERTTSRVLTRIVGAELRRLELGQLRELPPMSDDRAWDSAVTDAYHPAGTTRMSADPAGGVVDTDLQVHGVPGLSVVGSSVFPTAGYANPTLTIVALALRLADHLIAAGATRSGSTARSGA